MLRTATFVALLFLSLALRAQEGTVQRGNAAYYADNFHGRSTASGERYNKNAYTAAHRDLPFGTLVKVTNLDNNRTAVVRVNDRGPYTPGRIVDVSKAAAHRLGMLQTGTARVTLEVIGMDASLPDNTAPRPTQAAAHPVASGTPARPVGNPSDNGTSSVTNLLGNPPGNTVSNPVNPNPTNGNEPSRNEPATTHPDHNTNPPARRANFADIGTYSLDGKPEELAGKFCVQVGAFSTPQNAKEMARKLDVKGFSETHIQVSAGSNRLYKLVVGSYATRTQAEKTQKALKSAGFDGFISKH